MSEFSELDAKLSGLARALSGQQLRKVTNKVALAAKKDVIAQTAKDLGPDLRFRNWGKFRLSARYTLTSDTSAKVIPTPPGPSKVLTFGRKATRLPKRRARKVYMTPVGPRTATKAKPWRIGPTRGKGTFSKASKTIARETPKRIHTEVRKAISDWF